MEQGGENFWSCAYRSSDIITEQKFFCDTCPPKTVQGFKCAAKDIFPLGYFNCVECQMYSKIKRGILVKKLSINTKNLFKSLVKIKLKNN